MTQLETSEQGPVLRTSQASFHTQKNPLQTMQEDAPGKEGKMPCQQSRAIWRLQEDTGFIDSHGGIPEEQQAAMKCSLCCNLSVVYA